VGSLIYAGGIFERNRKVWFLYVRFSLIAGHVQVGLA